MTRNGEFTLPRRTFLHGLAAAWAGALTPTTVFSAGPARVIDFHSHFWAAEYLDALIAAGTIETTSGEDGRIRIHYPGNVSTVVRGHTDLDYREQLLDQHGIDMQVLSFSNPGTHVQPPEQAAAGAKIVNDAMAAVVAERPHRFRALATLAFNHPDAAARELERAVRELGFAGALVLSNINGIALSDPQFLPIFEKADELGAVIYIHPTYPAATDAMTEYRLTALIGFPMDTTVAAAGLVFSGVVERFPRIRWVLANLGGTIPFLAERLDRGFHAFPECRANIDKPPSEYLRHFYYDTVNFDVRALDMVAEFAGVTQLLAGSDFPQGIGSLKLMMDSVHGLEISRADREAILGGNAAQLLAL